MNKSNSFFPLFILVFFLGCSSEVVEPPAGKSKELTEAARAMDLNAVQSSSLIMFYKAASSNGICYAQIIPNDNKCTALDKD